MKNNVKRIISAVMAIAVIISVIPINISAYAQAAATWLIQPTLVYDYIYQFTDGGYALAEWETYDEVNGLEQHEVIIDRAGNKVTEDVEEFNKTHNLTYKELRNSNDNYYWHAFDVADITDVKFDNIKFLSKTMAIADWNGNSYVIDVEKNKVFLLDYTDIVTGKVGSSGKSEGDSGYIKLSMLLLGEKIDEEKYELIEKYALLDKNLNVVLGPEYDRFGDIRNNCVWALVDGKWGYIQFDPSTVTPNDKVKEVTLPVGYDYDSVLSEPKLNYPSLNTVKDEKTAVKAVKQLVESLDVKEKKSRDAADLVLLYAEEAIARANSINVSESSVIIKNSDIAELEKSIESTEKAVCAVLTENNIPIQRKVNRYAAINCTQKNTKDTVLEIDKEALTSGITGVKIMMDGVEAELAADYSGKAKIKTVSKNSKEYRVEFNAGSNIKLSIDGFEDNNDYTAVVDSNGKAVGGKYNPVTGMVEAKLKESGVFTVKNNEKEFDDIKDKNIRVQKAIKVLAAKGIISGTADKTFSPDNTITRAEVAAIVMRTLSKLDPNADGGFADVKSSDWYFGAAGSSKKYGIINGFEDGTFRANIEIAKDQITAVSARVLKNEMGYLDVENIGEYLGIYSDADTIADWAKKDVALATAANLVVRRKDEKFGGEAAMTRGDAAVILYNLFMKIW